MSQPTSDSDTENYMFDVIKSGWWSQGKITEQFEKNLSEYFPSNAIVVNNGTSAITAALLAHGIKPGDKVVVPDYTFIATCSAAKIIGAEILVADVDPNTLNVRPESIEKLVKEIELPPNFIAAQLTETLINLSRNDVDISKIKDIDLDESMIRVIAKQAEAERNRRAKVIHAEGELQASEKLLQASQILSKEPQALQLRYLQTLSNIADEKNSTIVFPLPLELLGPFKESFSKLLDKGEK